MKKISVLFCLFCLGFASPLFAQETFKWKEMGTFHSTAMLSFHGAEDGKLQPTRDSAAAMLQKAAAWQGAAIPAGKDATQIKALLQQLVAECTAITTAVAAKKADGELKPMVLKAHHTFHQLIEKAK